MYLTTEQERALDSFIIAYREGCIVFGLAVRDDPNEFDLESLDEWQREFIEDMRADWNTLVHGDVRGF